MRRGRRGSNHLAVDRTSIDALDIDHASDNSRWLLPAVGLGLFCIYLAILNIEAWGRLEAVCEVAMSKDALTLCLQFGAR